MRWKKILVGTVIAACCSLPCFADSLGEALAVTSDKQVAYTFYLGRDMYDIQSTMDGLEGWTKKKDWDIKNLGLWYTRTLEDGTVQELIFHRGRDYTLNDYEVVFKTKTVGEAVKLFYKTRSQMKDIYGTPNRHVQDSDSETVEYKLGHNDDALFLSYTRKEKVFYVRRIALDYSIVQNWAVKKYGKCKN